jgi:hypothetical protein
MLKKVPYEKSIPLDTWKLALGEKRANKEMRATLSSHLCNPRTCDTGISQIVQLDNIDVRPFYCCATELGQETRSCTYGQQPLPFTQI